MKQIYASILLTVLATLSTTCMEKETSQTNIKIGLTETEKSNLKNRLYAATWECYTSQREKISIHDHYTVINLIVLTKKAKESGIDEDQMGTFAYDKSYFYNPVSLYFNCLKKYNHTKETLPFNPGDLCINNNLAQALRQQHTYQSIEQINEIITMYPAYTNLITRLREVCHDYYNSPHDTLCKCLYSNATILFEGSQTCDDVSDFDDFYSKAYDNLSFGYDRYAHPKYFYDKFTPYYDEVYNFIALIVRIKILENTTDDKHIFSKILAYDPNQTWKGSFLRLKGLNYVDDSTKNIMALLYKLVEQYHHDRGHKNTPTGKQFKAYLSYKALDIALTDGFDTALFNENEYAFEEFKQLVTGIKTVLHPKNTNTHLQQYVDNYRNEI